MTVCHPFFIALFLFLPLTTFSQFNFESAEIQHAYNNVIKLKTSLAKENITELSEENIDNGIVTLLDNYLDIITLLTTEDKEAYKKLKPQENIRIKKIKQLDSNSPYYLYTLADIKLQWAFVQLIFGDYVNGFIDLKKSNDLIESNIKKYPSFYLNNKVKGLIDLLTETAPKEADIPLLLAGLKRTKNGSQRLIETSVHEPLFKDEINIYLALVNTYILNEPEVGLWKVKKTFDKNPDNLFALFTYANILSQLDKHKEIVDLIEKNKLYVSSDYLYIPYLDYLLGESQLHLLNYNESITTFRNFINKSLNGPFRSTVCFKLALIYSSQNLKDSSNFFLNKAKEYPKNNLYLDEYAVFMSENELKLTPELSLSRILYDGNHYKKAFLLLEQKLKTKDKDLLVEKYYRMAACAEKMKFEKLKIKQYLLLSIDNSSTQDINYYAAYSCIKLGYIEHYEGNLNLAKKLYQKSKSYKNHFYVSSVKTTANQKIKEIERTILQSK